MKFLETIDVHDSEKSIDETAVDQFATMMKAKLEVKRNQGYNSWYDETLCSNEKLSCMLRDHVEKGDPLDVALLAMMLYMRGSGILVEG